MKIKLGDAVEKVAKPIAKAIDSVLGTDIENCDSCKKRKEALNSLTDDKPSKKPRRRSKQRVNDTRDGKSITAEHWKFITTIAKQDKEGFIDATQYLKAIEVGNEYSPRIVFQRSTCAACNKKLYKYLENLYKNNK